MTIEQINMRHDIVRTYFFSQSKFQRRFTCGLPVGLCSGLVTVWWEELQKGNDAIRAIHEASPVLIRNVLLSQARSFYFINYPPGDRILRASEVHLLQFKYGQCGPAALKALSAVCNVENLLELDLVLLHGLPLRNKWQLSGGAADVVAIFRQNPLPGLYLLVARFWSRSPGGQSGHRIAIAVDESGRCRFYDPYWGEVTFFNIGSLASWFVDYWHLQRWDSLLQRGIPARTPLTLYCLSGELPSEPLKEVVAAKERVANSDISDANDFIAWLQLLRLPMTATNGE